MRRSAFAAFILGVFLVVTAGSVFAGNVDDPGIQDRIMEQQKRIDEGIASGSLTRDEAARVQDNLNRIKAEEARLKADGKLTKRERARLQHELDRNSDKIFKKKHNQRRR